MSIIPSLGTAASGINAFQRGLDVVSDNIANADTTAFKENDILFSELVSQFSHPHGGSRFQTGYGSGVDQIRAPFRQGAKVQTNNSLDLEIEGKGFFMLVDPLESPIPFFTRAGAFRVNKEGFVVNSDGLLLQGTTITIDPETGEPTAGTGAGPIDLSNRVILPKATTNVATTINLTATKAGVAKSVTGVEPFDTTGDSIVGGALTINGIAFEDDISPDIDDIVTAINDQTSLTGVSATEKDGLLVLTNQNGGPISIELNMDVDPSVSAKLGLKSGNYGGAILAGIITKNGSAGEDNRISGQGTRFLSELKTGGGIVIGDKTYIIQSIESDADLTLTEDIDPAIDPDVPLMAGIQSIDHASPITVFDSLGIARSVSVRFVKLAPTPLITDIDPITGDEIVIGGGENQWAWSAVVAKEDNSNGQFDEVQATGVMTFTSDGLLAGVPDPKFTTGGFDFNGGATANQNIDFDFVGTAFNSADGATQVATNQGVIKYTQNGFAAGILQTYSVDRDGVLNGLFTNGRTHALAQLLLATFPNEEGLVRVGGNKYIQTDESGDPLIDAARIGGRGEIFSGTLEGSNVNLTEQFVKLITYQRAFQANSRVITTSDEVIQEVVNLKR